MPVSNWLRQAVEPGVVRRALASAVVVGPLLIGINHGSAILRGEITPSRLVSMALTLLVPYCVSTYASVQSAKR